MSIAVILPSGRVERCSKPGNCCRHGTLMDSIPGAGNPFERLMATQRTGAELFAARTVVRDTGMAPDVLATYGAEAALMADLLTEEEQDALDDYRHTGYLVLNPYLRGGETGLREAMRRDGDHDESSASMLAGVRKRITAIDSAMAKAPVLVQPRVLYKAYRVFSPTGSERTTQVEINAHVREHFPVGAILTHDAYTSTSVDSDYMLSHTRRRPSQVIVHEILTDKGLPTYETGEGNVQAMEREVLLPRGMRFQVVNVLKADYAYSGHQPRNIWTSMYDIKPQRRFTVVQLREIP